MLYNAVDPHKLAIPAHDLHSMYGVSGKILLGVGRYVPQKNYALLLSALRLLLDQGYDASLVLVGEGSERPNLEQQIADLHLHGRAVLTGYRQDVPAFLQSADVFVMPSDFEGLPIAHVEAMFCGLPAVVSRYVPSLEIAGASSLVCKRSPESIAEQVRRLLDDENLRQELAEQGKRIAQEYTIDKYMVKMFEQYEQVLSQRS